MPLSGRLKCGKIEAFLSEIRARKAGRYNGRSIISVEFWRYDGQSAIATSDSLPGI